MSADLVATLSELASSDPDRAYVIVGGKTMTYGEADSLFRDLAETISTRGWGGRNNRIAVSTNDSAALLFTVWACLYSDTSLVFVPRCEYEEAMRGAMDASGAGTLLTDIPCLEQETWVVSLRKLLSSLANRVTRSAERLESRSSKGQAAFLFQTSGTEGEPKWVECHFWKCFEAVDCMWREGALDHARRQTVFLTPPLYHSYGLSSMLEYTRAGSTVVLPSGASPLGPVGELASRDVAEKITAIEGVPYFYFQFSRLAARFQLPMLRHLGFGGGGLDREAVERLRQHYPDITYSVRYGLTETPSVVSHKVFRPPYEDDWRSSGRIMSVYGVEIVDAAGRIRQPEEEGEIVVTGPCVANYAGEGQNPSGNVLRTGDIGYMTRSGELVVVGRRSVFLKHRGFRLSPELIESGIRSYSGIEDCRVLMRDGRLVAEVVSSAGQVVEGHDLLNHLAARLPAYSVPEDVIQVERIPRTPSGKIRRH
jgi:acyl-CoA synthetase (AMP-forming)/AMP-acid ligase II